MNQSCDAQDRPEPVRRDGPLGWLGEPGHTVESDPVLVEAELRAKERAFRRLGLPTFERGFNAPDDIFGPAAPMLTVAFVAQCLLGLTREGTGALFLLGGLAFGVLLALVGVIAVNIARGRPAVSVPDRVGWPEMAVFVVVPPLVELFVGDGSVAASVMLMQQLAIVGLTWMLFGFGLLPVLVWTSRHFARTLKRSGRILMKAVPLMIFFSFVLFFTQEIWQVWGRAQPWQLGATILLFAAIASYFIAAHIPAGLQRFIRSDDPDMIPLDRRQILNIETIIFVTLALQVMFIGSVIFVFFMVMGIILMPEPLATDWLKTAVIELNPYGVDLNVNLQLVNVALGTALVSALYYSVAMWLDEMFREDTLDQIEGDLGLAFAMRDEYLRLRGDTADTPAQSAGGAAETPLGPSATAR
jgi:hypothetical protein